MGHLWKDLLQSRMIRGKSEGNSSVTIFAEPSERGAEKKRVNIGLVAGVQARILIGSVTKAAVDQHLASLGIGSL